MCIAGSMTPVSNVKCHQRLRFVQVRIVQHPLIMTYHLKSVHSWKPLVSSPSSSSHLLHPTRCSFNNRTKEQINFTARGQPRYWLETRESDLLPLSACFLLTLTPWFVFTDQAIERASTLDPSWNPVTSREVDLHKRRLAKTEEARSFGGKSESLLKKYYPRRIVRTKRMACAFVVSFVIIKNHLYVRIDLQNNALLPRNNLVLETE